SPRRRLRLDRRDGDDLILESAARAEAEDGALDMASRLFFSLVQNDEGARVLLLSLAGVFPWVQFLRTDDVQAFLVGLDENQQAVRHGAAVTDLATGKPPQAAALVRRHPPPPPADSHYQPRGSLATHDFHGRTLEQWQVKVSGSGRIWYLPDDEKRTVWVIYA